MSCGILRRAGAALGLILLAACASDAPLASVPGDAPDPATTIGSVASASDHHETAGQTPRSVDAPVRAPDAPPPVRAERPEQIDRRRWAPLTARLSTACLGRGDEMVVTATSERNAGIGFAVGFTKPPAGEKTVVPDYAYFDREANPTGTVHWAFVIRPTIPEGPAVVTVVANASEGRGANLELRFRVDDAC